MGKMDRRPDDSAALDSPEQLKQHIDRILHLKEEVKGLNSDISDEYKLAEGAGFSKEALKYVVKRATQDQDDVKNLEALVHFYEDIYHGRVSISRGTKDATRAGARQRLDA
jgi:uncharacterized protein (UPF0335 family)